ncbi:hypothetical protein [Streptomyces sp. NPDC048057]|uniref:hypothetical protein n=1 Tax=Streptomyces sp. NPDC048057 TaxID=3155628 RepID=UPI00340B6582
MAMNPGIAAKIAASSDHARDAPCPRCHAPVLTARAGRVAALDVIADPDPIDATTEILARLDGRLTWHLTTTALGVRRIVWRNPGFAPHNKHPVLQDHRCPPQSMQETLI